MSSGDDSGDGSGDHAPVTGTGEPDPADDLLDGGAGQRLEEIRGRLECIAEELTEVSMDVLREAIDRGASRRPPIDKTLAQARRSVEKAARLLER